MEREAQLPVVAAFLVPDAQENLELSFGLRVSLCQRACEESDLVETCSWGWDCPRTIERIVHQLTAKLSWSGGLRWNFKPWCLVTHFEDAVCQADVVYVGQAVNAPSEDPPGTELQAKIREARRRIYEERGGSKVIASAQPVSFVQQEMQLLQLLERHELELVASSGLVSCKVLECLRHALDEDTSHADVGLPGPAGVQSETESPVGGCGTCHEMLYP